MSCPTPLPFSRGKDRHHISVGALLCALTRPEAGQRSRWRAAASRRRWTGSAPPLLRSSALPSRLWPRTGKGRSRWISAADPLPSLLPSLSPSFFPALPEGSPGWPRPALLGAAFGGSSWCWGERRTPPGLRAGLGLQRGLSVNRSC